jgi:ubiquinol-cytochrome c reductase cytochrome c subunit
VIRLLIVLTTACLLHSQTESASKAAVAPVGNAQNGKKLFENYGCYQCHGYVGQGGAGARLAPHPIGFAAFSKYVRQPAGEMPPYTAKVVSNSDLADIYAYLQSIPQPPAARNMPMLNY